MMKSRLQQARLGGRISSMCTTTINSWMLSRNLLPNFPIAHFILVTTNRMYLMLSRFFTAQHPLLFAIIFRRMKMPRASYNSSIRGGQLSTQSKSKTQIIGSVMLQLVVMQNLNFCVCPLIGLTSGLRVKFRTPRSSPCLRKLATPALHQPAAP